jgi:hypothetical protein
MLNILQENRVHALIYFLKMLNLPLSDIDDDPVTFLEDGAFAIRNALAKGRKASSSEGGYTPLMLYVCFNVNDDRLTVELAKSKDYVTQTKELIINEGPQVNESQRPKVSAITFAIAYGRRDVAERLYNLNYFSEVDLEEAVFFAIIQDSLVGIKFLRDKGVNLSRPIRFFGINPLHLAPIGVC